ncbi:N-acetylmuramoyl-L-alanine amidase [bacterium 0.1xD8-71]|nr:N-acetylmuramoyl-L-alanine amidase [bacterium 0.1xD8-71]
MLVFWSLISLVRNSVVLAVYLLFSVACFFTVHEHYIRDHLAPAPDSKLSDGNMEPDDPALSEPPIVPIEPAIPGEITIPDWILQDILPVNEYSRPGIVLSEVNGVVVHYTGNPGTTAEQNRSYYKNLAETKETYASSHFVIGMDGKIIQCVPLDEIAYCSTQRNDDTISIECCHSDDTGQFSQDTLLRHNLLHKNHGQSMEQRIICLLAKLRGSDRRYAVELF